MGGGEQRLRLLLCHAVGQAEPWLFLSGILSVRQYSVSAAPLLQLFCVWHGTGSKIARLGDKDQKGVFARLNHVCFVRPPLTSG